MGDSITTRPVAQPTLAPPIETQNAPITGDIQAPAAAAPQTALQPLQAQDTSVAATSPNRSLHHLMGSVLDALAGPAPVAYSHDSAGKLIATPQPRSTAQKIGGIVNKFATALAAPTPPGRASISANIGAGVEAVAEQKEKQDVLKRAKAKEDFDTEQQTLLRKHEIARSNALTMSTYFANKKAANEMTPVFSQNENLFNAAKASPELGAHVHEMTSEQVDEAAKKENDFLVTHKIIPMGWAPETDAKGNQVMTTNADGDSVPAFHMRMGVIDGMKDGKITLTPELAEDIKKYGKMARLPGVDSVNAGDPYEISQLIPILNKVDEQRKAVLEGWTKSELGWVTGPDGKETPVETNKAIPRDDPTRTRPLTVRPMALAAEKGKTDLEEAQAAEARAKGQEALANAQAVAAGAIGNGDKTLLPQYMDAIKNLDPAAQTLLRNVPPLYQLSLLSVATGDAKIEEFTRTLRKGVGQITAPQAMTLVKLLNPDWTEQLYTNIQKLEQNFSNGEKANAINSFNQFFAHAGQAADVVKKWQTTKSPLLNKSVNWLRTNMAGDPDVAILLQKLEPVKDEWLTMIKSGKAADEKEIERAEKTLNPDLNVETLFGNLQGMGHQGISRIDQLNEEYKTLRHRDVPNLIRQTGLEGATKLGLAKDLQKYRTGGYFSGLGQSAGGYGTPGGATADNKGATTPSPKTPHEVVINGTITGYTVDGIHYVKADEIPPGARPIGTKVGAPPVPPAASSSIQ